MLTGKTPWRAKTEKELARQLVSIPIKKLLPPSISQSSENFLLRTLNTDINERMSPEELMRFTLTIERYATSNKHLYSSSENQQFDGRNNNIRKQADRHETSLNKNSINTPTNVKRLTLMQASDDLKDFKNCSLPKTAGTISNKTEHFISVSNKNIVNSDALTQKEINIPVKEEINYDKKQLSKQLLSQVHLCRFLYKLIIRMK